MAEQIPYGVASSLINTFASLAFKEIASIYGVKSEIEWLEKTVKAIKAVLADADRKQHADQLIQLWIRDLKQVLYEADDLLDELHTQHLLRNRDAKDNKGKAKVREFFSSSNPIVSRHKISRKIRKIREKFNAVAETMSKLDLVPRVVEMKHEKSNWRETSSKPEENIIGREQSEKEIIDLLLNTSSNENVSLVAIVGIGGLGKTALTQLVYNNSQVNNFFNKKMWLCVSEEFDVKPLVKKILELSIGSDVNDQQLELLQNKLEESLKGQKYLLVLDDVWNEDGEKWSRLKKYLMYGAQGSKILLTTRNQTVADKMGADTSYSLKELTNDQSWTLLRSLAFDKDKIITQKLESIGQEIAKKCVGVPLAIRVMGSLLQSNPRESDWEAILEGDFWKSREGDSLIMRILKLSYDILAIELKQCFAYCSLYPKDWVYRKDKLIYLWMAHGFLEYDEEKQCTENVGEEYVHILLMKSFLQDVQRDELGGIVSFKMHDLMHDLCQSIASSDYCLNVEGRKNVVGCPIHTSFEEYNSDSLRNISDPCRLRTLLEIKEKSEGNPADLFVFKRLRSLDLSNYPQMRDLPKSIGKMRHLRYLNLSFCTKLTSLPKSISDLVNLQTLILYGCHSLEFSVDMITKLINLRRLDLFCCKAFEAGMPIGLGRMTTLQHLSNFIVGNDAKERKKAKLNELKELNLRGSLSIEKLCLVRDVEKESKDVNLRTKKNLISLSLNWGEYSEMKNSDALQLLENLRPHQNLKALHITEYPGVCLPDWLLSLTNLVQLKFSDIRNCQYLALEGLVHLKTLWIGGMDKLEYIYYKGCSSSTNFFPSLEELLIWVCGRLKGWVREENVQNTRDNERHHSLPSFSRLSSLQIDDCPELSCMPTFPNVRRLQLIESSTKPLLDTLIGPSTSDDNATSLSMLKFLYIEGIDLEALPEEWMQNLSSLKELSIGRFSSLEKLFCHMQNLHATLEEFTVWDIDSWRGDENYNIQCQNLCCLHSLKKIHFNQCDHLVALPEWICDLHSLRFIDVSYFSSLESFPEGMCHLTNLQTLYVYGASQPLKERCRRETGAEWPKIAHIPDIRINGDQI